jgi:hypothetical protein
MVDTVDEVDVLRCTARRRINSQDPQADVQKVAPEVGFEPTTNRLTADRSTTELLRNLAVGGQRSLGDI